MKVAYIDMQNIKLGIQELGREVDRERFYVLLKMKYKVDCIKIFVGLLPKYKDIYEQRKNIGYEVYFKKTYEIMDRETGQKRTKGNVDTLLMLHGITDYTNNVLEHGMLISGDGDFEVLIEYRKEKCIAFDIMIPNHTKTSILLRECIGANKTLILLDERRYKIQLKKDLID